MAIIDPFEAQQPQRRGIVDPFEAQSAPQIVDPFAQFAPSAEPKGESGFIPSIKRGYAGLESLATQVIPAMAAKAVGKDEYAERKMKEAAATQEEIARKYPAEIQSFTDIKGVGDALTYAKEAIGEALPSMLPSLFTGGAAALAGRGAVVAAQAAAEKAALAAAAEGITGEALKQAAIQAGLKAAKTTALKYEATGALVGSAAQNIPDVYQNIYEKTGKQDLGAALAFGSFNAALDAITPINLLRKAKLSGISPEELGAAWYKRAGKGAVEGMVTEGGTEALQEVSSAAAEKFVDNNQNFFTKDNFVRFVDAGLKGGLGGAGITSATNVAFGKRPENATTQEPTTSNSPIVSTTKVNVGGKESVKTTRRDGSVEIDGIQVTPPSKEPALNEAALISAASVEGEKPPRPFDEEEKAEAAQIITRLVDSGQPIDSANRIAAKQVLEKRKQKINELINEPTDDEVQQRAKELIDQGVDPVEALNLAPVQIMEERRADALAEAEGAVNVGQTITEPSGAGVSMAEQPDTGSTTAGAGIVEPSGVVPTGQDVAGTAGREGQEPVAVTEEDQAVYEAKKAKAQSIAKTNASSAFDQVGEYKNLDEALDSYRTNMADTLVEEGFKNDTDWDSLLTAAYRAFDAEVAKQQGEQVGIETPEAIQAEAQGQEAAPAEPITELTAEEQTTIQQELADEQAKSDDVIAEEAEISDDVADAVGDITTLPTEEVVEGEKPKSNRGRKPLSPEAKAASDERRKQQRTNYKQNVKTVDAAEAALNDALAPIDEETVGSEESLSAAQTNKRIGKIQAIKSLVLLARSFKGTKLGDRVDALLKNPAVTPQEIENVKKGIAAQVSKAMAEVKAGRADTRFSKMTTAQQALRHVIKTGNGFQKFLAERLLPFVKDVKFVVIEENAPLPSQITEGGVEADWNESRGMFLRTTATGERFVFVRGATGGPNQGVNNVTVLHEMLHAALNQKIAMADEALKLGKDLNSSLVKAYAALQGTMDMTLKRVKEMHAAGTLPEFMGELVVSDIFGDPREFVAYAMSHPKFQKFLMKTEGVTKQSLLTRFVNNVRQFFNMGPMHTSALADVISVTNSMLSSRLTTDMRTEIAAQRTGANATEISSELKKKKAKTNKMVERMEKSIFADAIRELPGLVGIRSMEDLVDALSSMSIGFDNFKLRQILPALQTEAVVQWSERSGVVGIREAWQYLTDMAAMRNKRTLDMVPVSEALAKLARSAPEQMRRLANVMHYSTLLYRDPTVAGNLSKDADLKKMWDGLTDANKKLYEQVRDFYKANHEQYHVLLEEQIANSKLAGTAGDGKSPKGKLIAQIKQIYEDGRKLYPYFPLMRYGQYWLRIGKGVDREFYMFENSFDRNMFLRKRVRQMQGDGSTESLKEMQESGLIDLGNDLSDARKRDLDASGMLKEIFNSIKEGVEQGQTVVDDYGNTVSSMSMLDADKLMDEIYQMYLQTLPDRNFRRQYMHRQGTTGFSGDIARNFAVTGTNMANQLARIKYGPRIMAELERANDTLVGNPDKARLGEFVSEMRMRAEQQVRPDQEDSFGYKTSALLNSSAYLWLMTSVKTAATQLTALPIFVAPVLTSNHGFNPFKVGAALAKSMAIFGTSGIRRQAEDGSTTFEFPSYLNNGLVKLTGNQKLAAQYMADRGISDNTLAYDLGNRRDTPTNQLEGGVRRAMRTTSRVMTSLFHHAERMIREITFMTSYDLYSQQTNKETGKKYTHEEALRAAEAETNEALGNYHASNRPRGLIADAERQVLINAQKPIGRTILQFKMFPAFVTTFFVRNAYRALAGLDAKDRAKAMAQLVGALTMSTALAGYVGIPGATMAMGAIQGMLNARDEDDEDPLEERDLEFWFRNIWLPQTFGNIKIGDHTLDEVLDRGLIATMTGYDISGSLSMNNMWVPDVKEQATSAAAMQEYLMSLLGPSASITFKQIPNAIDFFNKGEIMRGIEQLAPAFARGSLTAARYGKEGATTTSGAVIKEAEEFTQGQLLAQSMGFATEGLVARREAIFHLQGEILKVKRERTGLLDRLERELDKGSDEDVEKAFDKVFTFNSRNPYDAIGGDNIKQSIKKQIMRKMMSDRGMPIDKRYYPQLLALLEPSEKKLERERLMAQ